MTKTPLQKFYSYVHLPNCYMPSSSTQGNRFKVTHFSPKQCSVVVVGYDFPSPHFIYLCFNKFGKLRDKVIYIKKKKKKNTKLLMHK